jgi:hypothetical protein
LALTFKIVMYFIFSSNYTDAVFVFFEYRPFGYS